MDGAFFGDACGEPVVKLLVFACEHGDLPGGAFPVPDLGKKEQVGR